MSDKSVGKKPQQHPRFSNEELGLIKATFAENEELIRLCYKVFYQLPLEENESKIIKETFKGECLRSMFDKLFCPGLENEQLFFGVDDWLDVQIDKPLEEANLYITARKCSVDYIRQQVKELFGEEVERKVNFNLLTPVDGEDKEKVMASLIARKEIIAKIRNMFGTLQNWAGQKTETEEEMHKRLFADSAK